MNSKEKAIELAYVKLIGQEKFDRIKEFIDDDGWGNYGMVLETNKFEFKDSNSNEFYRPISLQGIETNNGWIKIESEKDLPSDWDKVHFVLKGFEEHEYSGYYNNGLFWNLNEAYTKEIVSHFQPVEKKPKPIY